MRSLYKVLTEVVISKGHVVHLHAGEFPELETAQRLAAILHKPPTVTCHIQTTSSVVEKWEPADG